MRLLGRGGFGEVWLAEKRSSLMTTQVALKLPLDPNPDLAAVQHEARLWLSASGHPNVLPVLDAEVFNGQVVIVSEYAAGGSLSGWLKQHGGKAPSVEAAVTMTAGILEGLEYLHSLKPESIIHRDLKPDNVLLQGGRPRLTDFGISRVLKTAAMTQHASGTPHYMPPEAWKRMYSPQSDIWAVGVMLYEMLSGKLPFPQPDIPSIYSAVLNDPVPPLPADIPDSLRKAVLCALEKEPSRRPKSAEAFRLLLNASSPLDPISRRNILVGGGIGLLVCGPFALYLHNKSQAGAEPSGAAPTAGQVKQNKIDLAEKIWIPAGTFQMGSSKESNEKVHPVTLTKGFWMYKNLVTVAQFRNFDKANGNKYDWVTNEPKPGGWIDDHPMVNVSWEDVSEKSVAYSYAKWAGVALPTEAQWEYAARGGLAGKEYPWGDNWDNGSRCANSVSPNTLTGTKKVGSYDPNGYGLYDMAGNVWEWCADYHGTDYYSTEEAKTDPIGPLTGSSRVLRGGSWIDTSEDLFRCAFRSDGYPTFRLSGYGFRCCSPGL